MPNRPPKDYHRWRWRALTIWIIIFTVAVVFGVRANRQRIFDNKQALNQIQKSRIESCKKTYSTLRAILVEAQKLGPQTQLRTNRYNHLIALVNSRKCNEQTKLEENEAR